jgi:hypothetical protein
MVIEITWIMSSYHELTTLRFFEVFFVFPHVFYIVYCIYISAYTYILSNKATINITCVVSFTHDIGTWFCNLVN